MGKKTHERFTLRPPPGSAFGLHVGVGGAAHDVVLEIKRDPVELRNCVQWLHDWVENYIAPAAERAAQEEQDFIRVQAQEETKDLQQLQREAEELVERQRKNAEEQERLRLKPDTSNQAP